MLKRLYSNAKDWVHSRWHCRQMARAVRAIALERNREGDEWSNRLGKATDQLVNAGRPGAIVLHRLQKDRKLNHRLDSYLLTCEGQAWCAGGVFGRAYAAFQRAMEARPELRHERALTAAKALHAAGQGVMAERLLNEVIAKPTATDGGLMSLVALRGMLRNAEAKSSSRAPDERAALRDLAHKDLVRALQEAVTCENDRWLVANELTAGEKGTSNDLHDVMVWRAFCVASSSRQDVGLQRWWGALSRHTGSPPLSELIEEFKVFLSKTAAALAADPSLRSQVLSSAASLLAKSKRLDAATMVAITATSTGHALKDTESGDVRAILTRASLCAEIRTFFATLPVQAVASLMHPGPDGDDWFIQECDAALLRWPLDPAGALEAYASAFSRARQEGSISYKAIPWLTAVVHDIGQPEFQRQLAGPIKYFAVLNQVFPLAPSCVDERIRQVCDRAVQRATAPPDRRSSDDHFDEAADAIMNIAGVESRMLGLLWLAHVAHAVGRNASAEVYMLAARNSLHSYPDLEVQSRLVLRMCDALLASPLACAFPEIFETTLFETRNKCYHMSTIQDAVQPELRAVMVRNVIRLDELKTRWDWLKPKGR